MSPVTGMIKALRVRGTVSATVKATNVRTVLTDNAEISQGSTVTTAPGASVVLSFSNGASVNLGTDSSLDIEQFTQDAFSGTLSAATITAEPTTSTTKLRLTKGELVSKVAKLNAAGGSTFTVNTPVGAAGIRGTTFRIVYRINPATGQALFSLTTTEGSVNMALLATGAVATAPVDVAAGTEIAVTANIDAAGNVTVTLPSGATTVIATNVSTATNAEIAASASVIAQAVANVVITPPVISGAASGGTEPNQSGVIINPINPTTVSPSQ